MKVPQRGSSPMADGTKFYVTSWDNGEILATHDTLAAAKKDCKGRGSIPTRYFGPSPVAYVAADAKDWDIDIRGWSETKTTRVLVYNPRFK